MDALFRGFFFLAALVSLGANYKTPNFSVTAPTAKLAKEVGEAAEIYRKDLAVEWTGKQLPGNWSSPCPIDVKIVNTGAGGATTFNFQDGEVYGWKMEIFGTEERILDSVLPHEINHTIFACHFRRPLPRWADEGAASLIENDCERMRLRKIHDQVMNTTRKIPLKSLLDMKNYPSDKHQVLTLYAEGHSLADFLIQRAGKPTYLRFLQLAHERGWEHALKSIYQINNVEALESIWDEWVLAGSPLLKLPKGTEIAENTARPKKNETIRAQSPDNDTPVIDRNLAAAAVGATDVTQSGLSRDTLLQPVLTQPAQSNAARVTRNGAPATN